ncbi:Regulatory protein RecX [Candidatus Magnetomoraceae bacterium gMMP-15]
MDKNKEYNKAMNTAVRLLSYRNHTEYEISQKLKQRGFDIEIISQIISECQRLKYINDEEYAGLYIEELKAKGYGTYRIRLSLKKKGIISEQINKFLSEHLSEIDEIEIARKAMQKKLKSLSREKDLKKRKEKIYRFLYSRGFSGSVISKLLRKKDQL